MALQFTVYTCPPVPTGFTEPDPTSKDAGFFSPLSCTLVYTPKAALLVDCPATIAATEKLAQWIQATLPSGCVLKYFVASHAHGDHFFGFPVLKTMFPGVEATASEKVLAAIPTQYSPQVFDTVWAPLFPPSLGEHRMPQDKVDFTPLPQRNQLTLNGHLVDFYDVPHGDTHANSFLHVPSLGLVVAGDIVYNGDCDQHLGEACTAEKRNQWIEGLSQIKMLRPKIIVPGHTFNPMLQPDSSRAQNMLDGTAAYIRGFADELEKAETEEQLFSRMRARYDQWNLLLLSRACHAGFLNKTS